uniref:Polyprotein allergen nematode domain-containing protein n=1 Tax=Panagrolaimus superbus TaxID=310955 RepID=A0A914Y620_9BILA
MNGHQFFFGRYDINACAYLWNIDIPVETIGASARVRRSTTSQNVLSTEWLTDDQNAQLSGLENDEYDKKYLSFFKELSGETKNSASKKIVKKCYAWLEDVASQEERDELKTLHHSDHSKCKEKVQEYLEKLPETKKTEIKEHLDVCEEIWYAEHGGHEHGHAHHHRRRRHHEHSFEDFAKEHLGWLTDNQKAEAMKLKDDKAALKLKMKEFFEATAGEKRQEAISSMKGACRQLLKHVLGDEKAAELKTMKESGASSESLKTKFEEYMNGITDEHLKEEANDHKEECMKIPSSWS